MLIFRQLFDQTSSTYTYLLADGVQALLIDPVFEQVGRDTALLRELGLTLVATLDSHVHADHVSAAWLLRQRCGSRVLVSLASGASGADRLLQHGDRIDFGARHLRARATPGHTAGCMSFVLDDQSVAFTGDALLIRGCGRTDFQQGSAAQLHRSVHEQLFALPAACLLYPAHDYRGLTVTSVAEERRFNPRLGGTASVDDFIGFMNHLGLAHPKLIDIAVPANLRCGEPTAGRNAVMEPTWAPLTLSFAGVWEIDPDTLAALLSHGKPVQVVDVREAAEWNDGHGHLPGARLLPLSGWAADAAAVVATLDQTQATVVVCRSGTRSAQATLLLAKAGFGQVANLGGGMLRWHAEGHVVDDASKTS